LVGILTVTAPIALLKLSAFYAPSLDMWELFFKEMKLASSNESVRSKNR